MRAKSGFRIESNSIESIRFCHGDLNKNFSEYLNYYTVFFLKSSIRFDRNRTDQVNKIHHLHRLNALYSVHFEVRFDRTEPNLLQKIEKIIEMNSHLIRFGKRLKFESFTVHRYVGMCVKKGFSASFTHAK